MILSKTELDTEETRELSYLGVAMGQMSWLRLYSDAIPFREGVERGRGKVYRVDDPAPATYDVVFTYDYDIGPSDNLIHIQMNDIHALATVVGHAVKRLYALGIAK